jgi:hypothetical protein
MAKKLTKTKARQILHDKEVHGHALTDKQRRFFGAIAGGAKPYKAQNGIEGTMGGLTDKGFDFNPAWGGAWRDGGMLQPPMAGANQVVPMYAMGGNLPGSVGFTYARTQGAAPSEGPYAKKTLPSAQNGKKLSYSEWKKQYNLKKTPDYNLKRAWELGYIPDEKGHLPTVDNQTGEFLKAKGHPTLQLELDWYNSPEAADFRSKNIIDSSGKFFKYVPKSQNGMEMKFYQEGLDFKPKTISRNGGWLDKYGEVVKDNNGYWNPENWGKAVEIDSPYITMQGVDQPLIGISDTGDIQYMEPGEDYVFDGESVTEYPVAAQGVSVNKADEYPLHKLDDLFNFSNYNKPKAKNGKWLDKYK